MNYLVIPPYNPGTQLLELLEQLGQLTSGQSGSPIPVPTNFQVIIVNDGSQLKYRQIFHKAQQFAIVLKNEVNMGKGYALKKAFYYIQSFGSSGIIVTADADGQHRPEDILRIFQAMAKNPRALVIGSRKLR